MQVLLRGYTGYCEIGNASNQLYGGLLSSFNFVVNNKILESNACNRIRFENKFKRVGLNVVRDFPNYQLSLSFQCNQSLYEFIINNLSKMFQTPVYVRLKDESYDYTYVFDECYVSSVLIAVEKDSIMTLSLNFVYFNHDFEIQQLKSSYKNTSNNGKLTDTIKLMPYYCWKVEYGNYNSKNLLSFAINYSRQISPKFGCVGSSNLNAREPLKLHFGLPQLTFQLDYLYNKNLLPDNSNKLTDNPSNNCLKETLSIKYASLSSSVDYDISFSNCVTTVYTPNLVKMDSYNTVSIAGKVFGSVTIS